MSAPKGNQFWRLRNKHGRDKLFASPELLWEAACEYFAWCDDNPLLADKAFSYQGEVTHDEEKLMRAYTMAGLCFYLECSEAYFRKFKAVRSEGNEGFVTVIESIEQTIYRQKFEGAAAGLLNANIIARDLGLRDRKDVDHTSKGEKITERIDYTKLSDDVLRAIISAGQSEESED